MMASEVMTLSDDSSCELPAVDLTGAASVKPPFSFTRQLRCNGNLIAEENVDLTDDQPATSYGDVYGDTSTATSANADALFNAEVRTEVECRIAYDDDCASEPSDETVVLDADVLFDCMFSPPLSTATSTASIIPTDDTSNPLALGACGNKEERLNKRRRMEIGRAQKRKQAELQRIYKPGECMQHMQVEMSPMMCEAWYTSDILRELRGARAILTPRPCTSPLHPHLITFARNTQGQMERSECGLVVLEMQRLAELVHARDLVRYVTSAAATAPFLSSLTLVVFTPRDYFKERGRKRSKGADLMTEIEFELAIIDLSVCAGVDCARVDTPAELALLVTHTTKAVAERPYKDRKYESDARAEFYMRGDNRQCITVDSEGHGLGQLWQQMMAVLPQSSLETARALCGEYPSPLSLQRECESGGRGGVERIATVGVLRATTSDARARALGPEFARRVATLFTSDCGDTTLA